MTPPPCVHRRPAANISEDLRDRILAYVGAQGDRYDYDVGAGPWSIVDRNLDFYVHCGSVGVHQDQEGITYGYVIKGRQDGTGAYELRVAQDGLKKSIPNHLGYLDTDSAFIINSDHNHELVTKDNDILVFVVQDFGTIFSNRKASALTPTISLDDWLDQIPAKLSQWIDKQQPKPAVPLAKTTD